MSFNSPRSSLSNREQALELLYQRRQAPRQCMTFQSVDHRLGLRSWSKNWYCQDRWYRLVLSFSLGDSRRCHLSNRYHHHRTYRLQAFRCRKDSSYSRGATSLLAHFSYFCPNSRRKCRKFPRELGPHLLPSSSSQHRLCHSFYHLLWYLHLEQLPLLSLIIHVRSSFLCPFWFSRCLPFASSFGILLGSWLILLSFVLALLPFCEVSSRRWIGTSAEW